MSIPFGIGIGLLESAAIAVMFHWPSDPIKISLTQKIGVAVVESVVRGENKVNIQTFLSRNKIFLDKISYFLSARKSKRYLAPGVL